MPRLFSSTGRSAPFLRLGVFAFVAPLLTPDHYPKLAYVHPSQRRRQPFDGLYYTLQAGCGVFFITSSSLSLLGSMLEADARCHGWLESSIKSFGI